MAKEKRNVPIKIKRRLKEEAGNKCANPGCDNQKTELHHIKQWHVYETHNEQDMIAVCPSCHDDIHHGDGISDETVYGWKAINRKNFPIPYIYIEPHEKPKILLGKIAITSISDSEFYILKFSEGNNLKFSVKGQNILIFDLKINNLFGKEIIRVVNNHVRYCDNSVKVVNNRKNKKQSENPIFYKTRKGKISLKVPISEEFIPQWALARFWSTLIQLDKEYLKDNKLTLLEIEVLEPGLVKLNGVWADENHLAISTKKLLIFDSLTRFQSNQLPLVLTTYKVINNDCRVINSNDIYDYTTIQIAHNSLDTVLFKFESQK